MRRFVVNVPPSSADRAPIVGMIAAGLLCAAAGFLFVRWVGGPVGDDSSVDAPALSGDDDVTGATRDEPGRAVEPIAAGSGSDAPPGGDDQADDDAGAATLPAVATTPADAGAMAANANGPDDAEGTEPAEPTTPAPTTAVAGSTPTAGRIAYVRCEVGVQNADGTWPPCPRFREIELAAARAVPRLAGCAGLAQAGRGFDVRILYRRGRSHPSLVVLPSSAAWAETVATCVRERFTGLPAGSSVDGSLTVAVRVQLGPGAATAAPPAIEPPPEPSAPTTPTAPAAPGPPAPAAPEPPAPPGAGPDGASADYRALARPRQGTVRSGAIMRAGPRDGAMLERPTSDERIEILGFDRGWVHVRWRGRNAWVFQTWTAQ